MASRTDSLQRLQCLVELHEFLHFITDDGNFYVISVDLSNFYWLVVSCWFIKVIFILLF